MPRGLPPHTTTDGVARIRIGEDSKPLTGSTLAQLFVTGSGRDVTADTVPGVRFADLNQEQVDRLRQTIAIDSERRNLAGLGNREPLEALGLISGYSRARVLRRMRSMRDEGLVEVRGRGRGAHYVPGQPRIGKASHS